MKKDTAEVIEVEVEEIEVGNTGRTATAVTTSKKRSKTVSPKKQNKKRELTRRQKEAAEDRALREAMLENQKFIKWMLKFNVSENV